MLTPLPQPLDAEFLLARRRARLHSKYYESFGAHWLGAYATQVGLNANRTTKEGLTKSFKPDVNFD